MTRKAVSLMLAACVLLSLAANVCAANVHAAEDTKWSNYSELLDHYAANNNVEWTYYTVCDLDNNGENELILGFGGSEGYAIFGMNNGHVVQYYERIASVGGLYSCNDSIIFMQVDLIDWVDDSIIYEVTLYKLGLNNNTVSKTELFRNKYTVDKTSSDTDWGLAIPEIAAIIGDGREIKIISIADRSLLITARLNDAPMNFEKSPVIKDGRVLVPLRAIFEAMGATVAWDGNAQKATSSKNGTTVEITIGSNVLYKNGAAVALDVPAQLIDGYTMVPVRAVAEAFGAEVAWDDSTKTVYINQY